MDYAVSIHGGSTALEVALRSLGIGEGDEVITPALTWVAPQLAVLQVGADPVFADVLPDNYCIDSDAIEAAITGRTRGIIAVHLGGYACDMDRILELARTHDIVVIEDCAQAHGTRYRGRLVGTMGALCCFSFEASKLMTAGEGGMIITEDPELGESCYSYLFTYDSSAFDGVGVQTFKNALRAEGMPCFSSASEQLAYDPSLFTSPRRSYAEVCCPRAEEARFERAVGLRGSGPLLGDREEMDEIVSAVRKIKSSTHELR